MKKLLSLFTLLILVSNCSIREKNPDPDAGYRPPGEINGVLTVNGLERTYILYVPPGTEKNEAAPLVIVLHGATGNGKSLYYSPGFEMNKKADERGILVAYPDGTREVVNGEGVFYWNAAHCCGSAYDKGIDDIAFIRLLIETLIREHNIDPSQVYVTGISNGGMMSHRIGAELSDMVAAIAPVSGCIGGQSDWDTEEQIIQPPFIPVPVIIFHGLLDREVPYHGGNLEGLRGRYDISVDRSAAFWVLHNNCNPEPTTETGPEGDYTKKTFSPLSGDSSGAEVIVYTMLNEGHYWPPKVGNTTATDIILDFFASKSLEALTI